MKPTKCVTTEPDRSCDSLVHHEPSKSLSLPSGDVIDAKNTLQSYSTVRLTAPAAHPVDLDSFMDDASVELGFDPHTANDKAPGMSGFDVSDAVKEEARAESGSLWSSEEPIDMVDAWGIYGPHGRPVVPLPVHRAHGIRTGVHGSKASLYRKDHGSQLQPCGFCGKSHVIACMCLLCGILAALAVPIALHVCGAGQCQKIQSNTLSDQVVAYINTVTLSDHGINLTHDDQALLRMLIKNSVYLPPKTPYAQAVWRQRYALATILSYVTTSVYTENECEWIGVYCEPAMDPLAGGVMNGVVSLNLDYVIVNGPISVEVGLLSHLKVLDLSHCAVKRTLPDTIGMWTNLRHFDVSQNALSGSLPESIGQWGHSLVYFNAESNALTGQLPDSLSQWTKVEFVSASGNSLTGTLPESIQNGTTLKYFNMRRTPV